MVLNPFLFYLTALITTYIIVVNTQLPVDTSNLLQTSCSIDDDCPTFSNAKCDANVCSPCNDTLQCTHLDSNATCDIGTGKCQLNCTESQDLCWKERAICGDDDYCSQCETNGDCDGYPGGSAYCMTGLTNLCVNCLDNTNCDSGQTCQGYKCIGCNIDDDCLDSAAPICVKKFEGDFCKECGDESHCSAPEKPHCSDTNVCVQCRTNSDCPDINKSFCDAAKTCQPCSAHADCKHLTSTPFCQSAVCSPIECYSDSGCYPMRSICDTASTQLCRLCTEDFECDRFTSTPYCSLAPHGCSECRNNTNCPLITASHCDITGEFTCQPCVDDTDCSSFPLTPNCKINVTCAECADHSDCPDILKSGCDPNLNVCKLCSTNAECAHLTATPDCSLTSIGCVECMSSSSCKNTLKGRCNVGAMLCEMCQSNNDCSHFSSQKVCSLDDSLGCVECMVDTDCKTAAKSICDTSTHKCKICDDDPGCAHIVPSRPYCKSVGCGECISNDNCTSLSLSYCNLTNYRCQACTSDSQCSRFPLTPACKTNTKCVECVNSGLHCPNLLTSYCNTSTNACGLCKAHSDCHFTVEKVCSFQASLGCVECMANTDCQNPARSYCNLTTHTCQVCSNNSECSHLSPTPYCSIDKATCSECLQSTHCTTLQKSYCNPTTLVCQTCADNNQCSHILSATYCSLDDSRCAECVTTPNCQSISESACNSTTKECQPCQSNPDCSHLTATPLCYDQDVTCVQCLSNTDCSDRFFSSCNITPHSCRSCSVDSECTHIPSMNKCWWGECVIYTPVCSPNYFVSIVQLASLNDFHLEVGANLASLVNIPRDIKIAFEDASTADFLFQVTRTSTTGFNIYIDVIKTIPNTKIQIEVPCPRSTLRIYANITREAPVKKIMYGSKDLKNSLAILGSAGESATTAMGGVSGAMVFIGANPALLWALLGLIQTFYYMLFINVQYPANVQAFFPIFKIADFDFIPNPMWIVFPNINDVSLPVPAKFEENEINGLFLNNAGNMLLLWIGNLVFYGFSFLVMKYTRNRPKVFTMVCSKLVSTFEWSGTFRIFISSYMELTIAAFLQLRVLTFSTGLLASSSVCGILFAIFGVLFPLLAYFIVKKYETRPQYVVIKFGTLVEEYNLKGKVEKYFTVMYIGRNLLIAAALVYLHDYAYIQIGLLVSLNLGFAYLLFKYKPYENKISNISNFVSELVFALVHGIIFVLIHDEHTHIFDDPQRLNIAWGIMIGCAVILVASVVLAFAQQYTMIKKTINLLRKFLKKGKSVSPSKTSVRQSNHFDHSMSDSLEMSSTKLVSSPGLSRLSDNSVLMSPSPTKKRKLEGLQNLARLNFESNHNKIRLRQPNNLTQKNKPKSNCASV